MKISIFLIFFYNFDFSYDQGILEPANDSTIDLYIYTENNNSQNDFILKCFELMASQGNFKINKIESSIPETECIDKVASKEQNICLNSYIITSESLSKTAFVKYFISVPNVIITKKALKGYYQLFDIAFPFKYEVFGAILISVCFLIIIYQQFESGYNNREFNQKQVISYHTLNNALIGFVGLMGGFNRYRPKTFCGMLVSTVLSVVFMVFVTAYFSNLASYLTFANQYSTCNEYSCILENRYKVQVNPNIYSNVINIYPTLVTNDMILSHEDLLNKLDTDISTLSEYQQQLQVSLHALMNDDIQAIIMGYDDFTDLEFLEIDQNQGSIEFFNHQCDYLSINKKNPIYYSEIGIPVKTEYVHKLDSLLLSITLNGDLDKIKNDQLNLRKQRLNDQFGRDQCYTDAEQKTNFNLLSYLGAQLIVLPLVILSYFIQCCQLCCCCTISIDSIQIDTDNDIELDFKSQEEYINGDEKNQNN